jgi:cytochrome P460
VESKPGVGANNRANTLVKGSAKYASTGGWGFAQFTNGKPGSKEVQTSCSSCHNSDNTHDSVFTGYSPQRAVKSRSQAATPIKAQEKER